MTVDQSAQPLMCPLPPVFRVWTVDPVPGPLPLDNYLRQCRPNSLVTHPDGSNPLQVGRNITPFKYWRSGLGTQ